MDKEVFDTKANKLIDELFEALVKNDDFECDLLEEILYIENEDGEYVINKHSASKQIWVSSPISGPHHFYYDEEQKEWLNTRTKKLLKELLKNELSL